MENPLKQIILIGKSYRKSYGKLLTLWKILWKNHLNKKKCHCHEDVSSGKLTLCYGKITMFNGKPSRNGPLSIATEAIDHQETCKKKVKFTIHTSFITIPSFIFCGNQMGYPTMTVMKKHRFQRDKLPSRDATVKKPPPACSSTGFRCSVPEDSQLRIGFLHCHFGGLYGGYFT